MAQATNETAGVRGVLTATSRRPDSAAIGLMVISAAFLVLGAAAVAVLLIKLVVPGLFDATAIISYGRLRPAAYALLVFGFGGAATQAIAYYLTPRLAGTPLRRPTMAALNGWAHAGVVLAGVLAVVILGPEQGEFAEFPLVIDILMAATLMVPALIVTETLHHRTEAGMFVSLHFVLAAVWWYPALHILANVPSGGGVANLLQSSLVSIGLVAVALPAAGLGAAFYVVTKETGAPLFSSSLARAAFWTLTGTVLVAAPARYAAGPAPAWLETIASVMSFGIGVAALAALAVLMLTIAGDWQEALGNPVLRVTLAGAAAYAVAGALYSFQGFRSVGAVVGLTTWHDGLALAVMLVAAPLLVIGFTFHAFPRATGRALFRPAAAIRGLRIALWGGAATAGLLIVAGLISGLAWNAGVASGTFGNTGAGFQMTLGNVSTLYTVAALTAVIATDGLAILGWTVVRTYTSGEARTSEVLMESTEPADE